MDGNNEEILRRLHFMRSHIAAQTLITQARRLHRLALKAGYRPNQARARAGHPDGGQWIDEGSPEGDRASRLWLAGDHPELPPEVPDQEPPTIRARNGWAVRVAKYCCDVTTYSHSSAG